MSQLSAELSTGRVAITIPNFLDRLEKAEVKLRLSAELMEFVNDGQLGNLDGVCLNLAEASDLVTALVKELHTLPEKEMTRHWSCAPCWEVAIVHTVERQPSEEVCHA